eukprot:TRINITY_DN27100_c0_g1_i1.p1 TRINITY_DN27100_c0_g1~~TRINITY_DN27100_c0_g1_i1.p1  ORF type:complete len:497 (+),score=102.52 TRINITY_DN27100_c0_g1_i1:67-1557(+)
MCRAGCFRWATGAAFLFGLGLLLHVLGDGAQSDAVQPPVPPTPRPVTAAPPPSPSPPPAPGVRAPAPAPAGGPPTLPLADGGQIDFDSAVALAGKQCETLRAVKGGGQLMELTVCWSPQACVGSLRASHREPRGPCPVRLPAGISDDPRWEEYVASKVGPDSLWAVVEGTAEISSVAVRYAGDCRYQGVFGMVQRGAVGSLVVKWETDSWWGLQEKRETVSSFRNKYITRGRPRLTCAGPSLWRTVLRAAGPGYAWGRFVAGATPVGSPQWAAPVRGGGYEWRADGTGPATRADRDSILKACKGRSVTFTGDSQVRTVWRHWQAAMHRRRADTGKVYNETESYGDHALSFFWDPYLQKLADLPRSDTLVLGFGAWPASFGQWKHSKYEAETGRLAEQAAQLVSAGTFRRVIWVGSPAWPKPRRDTKGFRITNMRLGLWNSLSRRHFLGAGHLVADIFALSWPHVKLHRGDGMHYDNSVVLWAAVDVLLPLACPGRR